MGIDLDKIEKDAAKCEEEVHGCGRCTLKTLMEHFELGDEESRELIQKAMLPLSGGIAQTRNVCGALLGGIMAIGMASLPGKPEDANMEEIRESMRIGRECYRAFEEEIGHARCLDIREVALGRCFDTVDPDEYQRFQESGGYELASKIAGKAARLAAEHIQNIKT